ncbi:recombinase family protein [Enterocloster bolteae]|uniref:recombinase family protein n=1 Tax=Enterocloster bolteae TaxID=208479 RepID=UPI0004B6EDEA|nr:recombinase family protein [Enterocloster bolteae]UOX71194.1 recombinase family protein [Enterocloster bolteae]
MHPKEHTRAYRIADTEHSCVCICRVSTDDDGQYHSYDAQMGYYKGLIQKNPAWEFCGIYVDEGISGTSRWGREDFQRMLEECEKGRIDLILTKSIPRFARNTVDCISWVRKFKDKNVAVYFEKVNLNSLDDSTEMILPILSSQAQEESRAISTNVKWGYARKFEKGESTRQRSYGFRKVPTGEMCIVEEEVAVIRNMARGFLNGDSLERIKHRLEDAGIETTIGKKIWSTGTSYNILTNEKVMGDVVIDCLWDDCLMMILHVVLLLLARVLHPLFGQIVCRERLL